jgi:CheY-like chemotaxis protein
MNSLTAPALSSGSRHCLKLLVVDDEPIVCECIAGLLRHDGHQVQAVNSGRAALAIFEKERFDLVFMDYSMPEMKGDELAVAIKALAPGQPIIMITGNAPSRRSLVGVDLIINKPVMLEDLRNAIACWWPAVKQPQPELKTPATAPDNSWPQQLLKA